MNARLYLACLSLIVISGCAEKPKYNWGSYSSTLYDYYRDATKEAKFVASLEEIVKANGPKKKAPPGIFAEYGYMEMSRGNVDNAIKLFEQEKSAWPESAVFMDAAIKLARSGNTSSAPSLASNKPAN